MLIDAGPLVSTAPSCGTAQKGISPSHGNGSVLPSAWTTVESSTVKLLPSPTRIISIDSSDVVARFVAEMVTLALGCKRIPTLTESANVRLEPAVNLTVLVPGTMIPLGRNWSRNDTSATRSSRAPVKVKTQLSRLNRSAPWLMWMILSIRRYVSERAADSPIVKPPRIHSDSSGRESRERSSDEA